MQILLASLSFFVAALVSGYFGIVDHHALSQAWSFVFMIGFAITIVLWVGLRR